MGEKIKEKKFEILNYDELPKRDGIGALKGKKVIDWGEIVEGFIFKTNGIYGFNEFEFARYESKGQRLFLKCNGEEYDVNANSFLKGHIGKLINKITKEFKIEIGEYIIDNNRNLMIINRKHRVNDRGYQKYNEKWYKYKCNKCGFENWVVEGNLLGKKYGCSCCASKTVVLGINTIYDTDPWMMSLGVSEEDAKTHTKSQGVYIEVICPNCGREKKITINKIYNRKSISCNQCSDGISYPEKFMYSILEQLNIEFQTQLNKTTFSWCDKYKYDFYIPSLNMIIETHGGQHYEKNTSFKMSLEEVQENDRLKKELALKNGIKHYITIDCGKSEYEFLLWNCIKNLRDYFDMGKIDWIKCEEFALSNLVKQVCDYWNNKEEWETTKHLGNIFGLNGGTIVNYLKKGTKLGWCSYDVEEEKRKSGSRQGKASVKQVEIFKNGQSLGIFESITELEEKSIELFGVKLLVSAISAVCNGKYVKPQYKGFTFKFLENNE